MKILTLGGLRIRPVVIVLQERPEKTGFILRELNSKGIYPDEFNGFNSTDSGLETRHPYELDSPGSGWNIGRKGVGIWLSQYSLLSALLWQPDDYFLILEWDAKFAPDWAGRTDKAIRGTPKDFDMLYLGSCCAQGPNKKHISGDVWEVNWPMCNHATIVAKKAIMDILRTQRKVYAPWDISLLLHTFEQTKKKVYCVLPRIVDQFDTVLQP